MLFIPLLIIIFPIIEQYFPSEYAITITSTAYLHWPLCR